MGITVEEKLISVIIAERGGESEDKRGGSR